MAMKKDDDKSKKTLSGKKPATFGGANSKLMASKPTALTSPGPRAIPSRPMGRDVTGERNFDKTPRARATLSVGPATMSMGGKTSKSTGGMNMTGYKEKKSSSPMAKMSGSSVAPSTQAGSVANLTKQEIAAKRNRNLALGIGGTVVGAGVMLSGGGKKIKQAAKWIGDTKERKARNRAQKAENDAMIVERKAKAEAKNPSTPIAKVKASKSTMKNIKRLKKGQ